jgi:hypothetical protein
MPAAKKASSLRVPMARQPFGVAGCDLGELGLVERVRASLRAVPTLRRDELDVADPERDGRLGDAELAGDVAQRHAAGAHLARPLYSSTLPR